MTSVRVESRLARITRDGRMTVKVFVLLLGILCWRHNSVSPAKRVSDGNVTTSPNSVANPARTASLFTESRLDSESTSGLNDDPDDWRRTFCKAQIRRSCVSLSGSGDKVNIQEDRRGGSPYTFVPKSGTWTLLSLQLRRKRSVLLKKFNRRAGRECRARAR